jgi:hypothetical protein
MHTSVILLFSFHFVSRRLRRLRLNLIINFIIKLFVVVKYKIN